MNAPAIRAFGEPEVAAAHDISAQSRAHTTATDFDEFYRRQADPIGRALDITLNDPELAEDALNEAMVRALQRWKRVSRFDNPAGWVYRVAMNWALSWMRRRRRERDRPISFATASTDLAVADIELGQSIESLPIDHRAVVVCRYLLDLSTAQTAVALDIAEGTVKSRLARALDSIRTDLGAQA